MFGLFKTKSPADRLEIKYKKLLKEAYQLSSVNRTESDKKHAEAQEVLGQLEALRKDN